NADVGDEHRLYGQQELQHQHQRGEQRDEIRADFGGGRAHGYRSRLRVRGRLRLGRASFSADFSLAPGFSPVSGGAPRVSRFSGLAIRRSRKRFKPFSKTSALTTRLKPGANETTS